MKKFISTLTILSCFLLAACEDKVYDVSYYAEHLEQAQDVVEKCSKGICLVKTAKMRVKPFKKSNRVKHLKI